MQSYLDLLRHVKVKSEGHDDRTGVGTRSVFGYQWRHKMSDGFPLLTTKKLPFRWIAEELFWFLSGSTDEKDLRDRGVDIWKEWATAEKCSKFCRPEGNLGPVYGHLWRNFGGWVDRLQQSQPGLGTDQIAQLFNDLTTSPNSRRLIVSGWHPEEARRVELPPCHTLFQMKVHENNSLSLHLYARSIDSFLGLPFNIASYALLLKLIAHTMDREANELIISFGDLHIYNNHIRQVDEQLSRTPTHLPRVMINDSLRGSGLRGLLNCRWQDLDLYNYEPQSAIPAPVAV
jgi:thymidylate synthase